MTRPARHASQEIARRVSVTSAALLAAAAAVVLWLASAAPDLLVRARFVLFTAYVDAAAFDAPPDALRRDGFIVDDTAAVRAFAATIETMPGWRARLDAAHAEPDQLRRAEALARAFATYGRVGDCGTAVRLLDRLRRPGCCSDHSEVLLALSPLVGLTTREVHMREHTLAELWLPAERRWALVDPMFGYVVRDGAGRALSLSEVRRAELAGGPPVRVDAFRAVSLPPERATFVARSYAGVTPSERILYTNGADVLREDALRAALLPAPKVVARLVGAALGVTPTYCALIDDTNGAALARLAAARDVAWVGLLLCALGTLAWPATLLWSAARGRAARRTRRHEPRAARAALDEVGGA